MTSTDKTTIVTLQGAEREVALLINSQKWTKYLAN